MPKSNKEIPSLTGCVSHVSPSRSGMTGGQMQKPVGGVGTKTENLKDLQDQLCLHLPLNRTTFDQRSGFHWNHVTIVFSQALTGLPFPFFPPGSLISCLRLCRLRRVPYTDHLTFDVVLWVSGSRSPGILVRLFWDISQVLKWTATSLDLG